MKILLGKSKLFITKGIFRSMIWFIIGAAVAGHARAEEALVATDLGTLNSYFARSIPTAMNNAGQIIGYSLSNMDDHAFLWENGVMTDLGTLSGLVSYAYALNDNGQVVGWASVSGLVRMHAVLWNNGAMTDLGTLGSSESYANKINNSGQIIGSSSDSFLWQNGIMARLDFGAKDINNHGQIVGARLEADGTLQALIWNDGATTDIGRIGSRNTRPLFINDAGQVAGNCYETNPKGRTEVAFFWQDGKIVSLGTLGGSYSYVTGLSQKGHVVGNSVTAAGEIHGFVWKDGVIADLGTLGGIESGAGAVNSAGQVVGGSMTASGRSHAFLWENGIMTDLGTLNSPYPENDYSVAYLINEVGQIVGMSYSPDSSDLHGVLWMRKNAPAFLADLIVMKDAFSLPKGLSNSLGVKLRNAETNLTTGDTTTACNAVNAFVQESMAQSGKALTQEQANKMIKLAHTIEQILSCR